MLSSCTHMATLGIKGLIVRSLWNRRRISDVIRLHMIACHVLFGARSWQVDARRIDVSPLFIYIICLYRYYCWSFLFVVCYHTLVFVRNSELAVGNEFYVCIVVLHCCVFCEFFVLFLFLRSDSCWTEGGSWRWSVFVIEVVKYIVFVYIVTSQHRRRHFIPFASICWEPCCILIAFVVVVVVVVFTQQLDR